MFLNECRPMQLFVAPVEGEANYAATGITKDRIQTLAESRLRAARLYDADAGPFLAVNVNVVGSRFLGSSFSVEMAYGKRVYDPVSDLMHFAPTWFDVSTGHNRDAGLIL